MNFLSYVAELSRGWDEPNARDMGRMTSQPNAKAEMYILKEEIDMKANIAAMVRRLEELEMKKNARNEEDARSASHLSDTIATYALFHLNHPNFSWKPQPPQYKQHVQVTQQASNLEQAMVNLSKVVGDFVGAQKSINAHLSQRIDSVESSLNKRMDEVQNDLSQKIDNLQDSISRFANLNTVQEKGNFPSQPYQNSKGIHEVEAQKGESSMVKEVKTVIPLSRGIAKMMKEKKEKREFWPLFCCHFGAKLPPGTRVSFLTPQANFRTVRNKHFLELKLCIPYIVSKLGKSGIQFFKRRTHFATVGQVFGALPGAQIMHNICCFEAWEVRNPALQMVHDLDLKRRSYGCLKTDYAKLSGNFAP
ncbi:hypothetical protein CK203_042453 [Vitis vinifera]|uniref:Uncharacterized protein n=1 Tax=Vitis vinifera TaxID=29760 RepID=A0A438HF50_VITVI|nr:hypothetical protein CK203_042453 [Vitis vinifera]